LFLSKAALALVYMQHYEDMKLIGNN